MIGNILCWVIAISLILANNAVLDNMYERLLFAMGFIFLGILSKAVDYHHGVHNTSKEKNNKNSSNS
jgi:hypothetical protein